MAKSASTPLSAKLSTAARYKQARKASRVWMRRLPSTLVECKRKGKKKNSCWPLELPRRGLLTGVSISLADYSCPKWLRKLKANGRNHWGLTMRASIVGFLEIIPCWPRPAVSKIYHKCCMQAWPRTLVAICNIFSSLRRDASSFPTFGKILRSRGPR